MRRQRGGLAQEPRHGCQRWLIVPVALVLAACSGATDPEADTASSEWTNGQHGEPLVGVNTDGRVDCSAFRDCGDFPCDQGANCISLGGCGEVCATGSECDLKCVDSECVFGDSLPPSLICSNGVRESFGEPQASPKTETSLETYTELVQAAHLAVGNNSCTSGTECELAPLGRHFCAAGTTYVAFATATASDEFHGAVAAARTYSEELNREASELLTCEVQAGAWEHAPAAGVTCSTAGICELEWALGG